MGKFKVGDKVRVKRSVEDPWHSWGRVSRGEVGVIARIDGDDSAWCDFPKHHDWHAKLSEMEKINVTLENK